MHRWWREVTVPLAAEEVSALLNGVIAGESFKHGIGPGGTSDPQAKMDVGVPGSTPYGASDPYQQVKMDDAQSDKIRKLVKEGYPQKQAVAISYDYKRKGKLDAGGFRPFCKKTCTDDHEHNFPPKMKKVVKHAADEIAALFAGNPHDVSGENREHGQFAPGAKNPNHPTEPGLGSPGGPTSIRGAMDQTDRRVAAAKKPQPTGSPLDPATGVKPPPEPHDIHKQNMDYHNQAAKAMQSMVKQHLDLAKVALSPEDRQQHINQARQMKQLASTHVTEAGKHAQKLSEALKQKAAQDPGSIGPPTTPAEQIRSQGMQKMLQPASAAPSLAQRAQQARQTIQRQFPNNPELLGKKADPLNKTQTMPLVKSSAPAPKISHSYTNAQGQQVDVPASTGTGGDPYGEWSRRADQRQQNRAGRLSGPLDLEKLKKAREDADWLRKQQGGGA